MSRVKVYFEGARTGPFSKKAKTEARLALQAFLNKLNPAATIQPIPCGSRSVAYRDFCTALRNPKANELPLLLVDSEDPFPGGSVWAFLGARDGDGWQKPRAADENHVYLMVQVMETWLVADRAAFEKVFRGQGVLPRHLPVRDDLENISKSDIYRALERATRGSFQGSYGKGTHSWKLLAAADPLIVERRCSSAERLFDYLRKVNG